MITWSPQSWFGVNSGFNTILVLSGETTLDMLNSSDVNPSIVFKDLNEIVPILKMDGYKILGTRVTHGKSVKDIYKCQKL
mgnify:CR=1 FL=1